MWCLGPTWDQTEIDQSCTACAGARYDKDDPTAWAPYSIMSFVATSSPGHFTCDDDVL
jgi:hypothetical protein